MKETNTYKNLKGMGQDNFPDKIIVHHTGGTDKNPLEDTSHHTAEIIEAWHLAKPWEGLGYQYVIHKDGEIWKGRPEHYHGAHDSKNNKTSIGICLSGNFDLTLPTQAQKDSLVSLIRSIKERYPAITDDTIYPHRKFSPKTCYGNKLSDTWAKDLLKVSKEDKKKDIIKMLDAVRKEVESL